MGIFDEGWGGMRRRYRWALICYLVGFFGVLLVYRLF
jgi:hypothetical protein